MYGKEAELLCLALWSRYLRDDDVKNDAPNVPKEVVAPPVSQGPLQWGQKMGRHKVLDHHRRGYYASNTIETPLVWGKVRRNLFLSNSPAVGHQGDRQEEKIVSWVEAVPKSRRQVNCSEICIGSNIYIASKPKRCLFVPFSRNRRNTWCHLDLEEFQIVRMTPALDFAIIIKSFKASVPDIVCSFCILPAKVISLPKDKLRNPHVSITPMPGFLQEFRPQDHWNVLLWINRIKQRNIRTSNDIYPKMDQTE